MLAAGTVHVGPTAQNATASRPSALVKPESDADNSFGGQCLHASTDGSIESAGGVIDLRSSPPKGTTIRPSTRVKSEPNTDGSFHVVQQHALVCGSIEFACEVIDLYSDDEPKAEVIAEHVENYPLRANYQHMTQDAEIVDEDI
jgi:hypothetical protein